MEATDLSGRGHARQPPILEPVEKRLGAGKFCAKNRRRTVVTPTMLAT